MVSLPVERYLIIEHLACGPLAATRAQDKISTKIMNLSESVSHLSSAGTW
jgi:hypothetical protein